MSAAILDGDNDKGKMDAQKLYQNLDPKQKRWLSAQCKGLLGETEDLADAKSYAGDVVTDMIDTFPELEKDWEQLREVVNIELKIQDKEQNK